MIAFSEKAVLKLENITGNSDNINSNTINNTILI
jgi:hypothetical protein